MVHITTIKVDMDLLLQVIFAGENGTILTVSGLWKL